MKRMCCLLAAGVFAHVALMAQIQPGAAGFQQAEALGGGRGGGRGGVRPMARTEAGKPYSATVTTQTTQTFMDGTKVNQTSTSMEYRDMEGRVRTEMMQSAGPSGGETKIVTIRDPVAGATYRLDPARKTATKAAFANMVSVAPLTFARGGGGGGELPAAAQEKLAAEKILAEQRARGALDAQSRGGRGGDPATAVVGGGRGSADKAQAELATFQTLRDQLGAVQGAMQVIRDPNQTVDDLGTMAINGVPARGTRVTTVVPVGAIGNDREFRSVSERWFSPDLNLLIKSVNTDPRFGTTTYELTNISRLPPDPTLFQVPPDYTFQNTQRQ